MCLPFAEVRYWRAWVTGFGLALLAACSASPTQDSSPQSPTTPATSAPSKTQAATAPATTAPVETPTAGPPPVPPEATQRFEKALTLLGAGDFGPAAQELQALADSYPDYSGPLTNLGIVHLKTGKLADAEKALLAATKRGEPNAAAYNQLGITYRRMGKFKEAEQAYGQAIQIDPSYALAHLNLGVLCDMYLQQPEKALQAFERYQQLARNPDERVAGWIKELQGRVGAGKPAAPASNATAGEQNAAPQSEAGQVTRE